MFLHFNLFGIAAYFLESRQYSDGMTQGDITTMDILPEGSVKSTLKRLFDSKKIKKNTADSSYYIPNYRINEVVEKLNKLNQ
jgi:hypothetical protein